MFDNFRGVVSFKAGGRRLYPFIDKVRELKIGCRSQTIQDDWLYAKCYAKDFEIITEIAQQFGITVERLENKGAIFAVLKYKWRVGIALGVIIALGITFYFSNTITQIEINGCETVDKSAVEAALTNLGIEKGAFIPAIDFDSCERRLMLAIDDISWAGIRSSAGRIVVDVHEAVDAPLMLDESTPCNIVSMYDAQIVNISVLEGVGCVQSGYTVKKGDILISGVQEGIKGTTTVKHALGNITGVYNVSLSFAQNFSELVRVETGEYCEKKLLDLLSLQIPLDFSKNNYGDYNYNVNYSELYLFDKKLPIAIESRRYTECEYILKTYDKDKAQSLLYDRKCIYEENFLKDVEILSEKAEFEYTEEQAVLKISYTLMGEIGQKNEILIKNFN